MESQPAPDLLRIYTDHEHGGVMRVDYQGHPIGVLSTMPFFAYRPFYAKENRSSQFDRREISLEIMQVEPGYFDPIPKPPFNTVNLRQLSASRALWSLR
jgi:hypothetical protein